MNTEEKQTTEIESEKILTKMFDKYVDESIGDIVEELRDNYDLETPESNNGHDEGGSMGIIFILSEYLSKDQHQELADYFKTSVEDWPE